MLGADPRRRAGRGARDAGRGAGRGDLPGRHRARRGTRSEPVIPGEVIAGPDTPGTNAGRPPLSRTGRNTGGRPVQVGTPFPFGGWNPAMALDRDPAGGPRLAVPAGTSVRFE